MNTVNFTAQDHRDLRQLSAVGSGTGGRSARDASSTMASGSTDSRWKGPPQRISTPASQPRKSASSALNPYGGGRLKSNLDHARGEPPTGNHTAQKTVLGGRGRAGQGYRTTGENKRQKLEPPMVTSTYFADGGAGTGKGKGKAVARSEPEVTPDTEEDLGMPVSREEFGKHGEKESTPDPLDCLGSSEARSKSPRRSPHAFERPSPQPEDRLPSDGASTARLHARLRPSEEAEVVDVDALSDDIQSARWSDDEGPPASKVKTPNGRQEILSGNVKQKITMYEGKRALSPTRPPKSLKDPVRTIDLKQHSSVKGAMKPRTSTVPSLSRFNPKPLVSVDPIATAPTFKRDTKPTIPTPLPLEAISLGCSIMENTEDVGPPFWVRIQHVKVGEKYLLSIARDPTSKQDIVAFHLDRDFDSFKFTEPDGATNGDGPVIIQFQTTKSATMARRPKEYEPGSKRATGWVTLKFYQRHANFNGPAYPDLVNILEKQISKQERLRGVASGACWETVQLAMTHKAGELARNATRPTRASAASMKSPPISAGPSNGSSTTVVRSEEDTSISAASHRMYGTERMVTRRAARETRKSATPENLEELVLVYPPSGTGAVNITRGDLKRLDNGQYLNDTLIEFGLKLWLHKLRDKHPELAEQVHVFNSFFFKKLNAKKDIQETYPSVRKWTSKVDIFKKKYIIVPINENFHWYLAIIVNPENMLYPPPVQAIKSAPQTRKRKRDEQPAPTQTETAPEEVPSESRSDTTATEPDPMAVDHESEGDDQKVENLLRFTQSCNIGEPSAGSTTDEKKTESRSRSGTQDALDLEDAELQYPTSEDPMEVDPVPGSEKESKPPDSDGDTSRKKPPSVNGSSSAAEGGASTEKPEEVTTESKADGEESSAGDAEGGQNTSLSGDASSEHPNAFVYTFDSLGTRHPRPGNRLAKYLQHEAMDKKGYQLEDTRIATYRQAKAPMQKNFCDCGLFVLAFAEAFMENPVYSVERIQSSQIDWYTGSMENLRESFRERTIALSEAWKKERAEKEGPKDEAASEKPKAKAPDTEVIVDSSDDEPIIVSEVVRAPPSKAANKGGKRASKASRLRG